LYCSELTHIDNLIKCYLVEENFSGFCLKQLKLSSTILHASKEVNILQKNIKTKTKKQKFSKNKKKNKKQVP